MVIWAKQLGEMNVIARWVESASRHHRVCKPLCVDCQPDKDKFIYRFFFVFVIFCFIWCHLFDVDTVSTESGITELAIVARLDKTSTLVATLHLQIRSNQIRPNHTKHDQLDLTRPDQADQTRPTLPHLIPLGLCVCEVSRKRAPCARGLPYSREFFRSRSEGREGVLLLSPGFSPDWGPDTPTFIKCTSALSQVGWPGKVLPLPLYSWLHIYWEYKLR